MIQYTTTEQNKEGSNYTTTAYADLTSWVM